MSLETSVTKWKYILMLSAILFNNWTKVLMYKKKLLKSVMDLNILI